METTIKIGGMSCQGCVSSIETALKKTDGIAQVKVHLKDATATVMHDSSIISAEKICERVNDLGFDASL